MSTRDSSAAVTAAFSTHHLQSARIFCTQRGLIARIPEYREFSLLSPLNGRAAMFLRIRVTGHGGGRKIDQPEDQANESGNSYSTLARATCLLGTLALGGCDQPVSTPPSSQENQLSSTQPVVASDSRQRQADFLNRIRAADPEHRTIDRAMLNAQNELGLILDRSVEMDRVPDLMRSILAQMARQFPGRDLTILTYTPSNPPHKIGTAHLNSQTREMTYTPAQ
jgi:hypothetical protein